MLKIEPQIVERFSKYLDDPDLMNDDQKKKGFFNNPEFQPFFLISFAEFLKIWGTNYDWDTNPERLNKWLIYAQLDWYNNIYNETWCWKWYPLFLKFALNTVRFRQTSIILSFLYLGIVDRLLDRYMVFKHLHDKKLKINTLLNHTLSKNRYIKQRNIYFKKYKDVIHQGIKEDTVIENFGDLNYITVGHTLNIYNPNFEWDQEVNKTHEEVRRLFFIRNNQLALLTNRISFLYSWFTLNIRTSSGRKKMSRDIKYYYDNNVHNLPERIMNEIHLFSLYRNHISDIPDRHKINSLLEYDKINKQKLYYEGDDLKLQISKVINTFNYYTTGVPQFKEYKLKIFNRNLFEIQPQFRTESFLYDFVTFTVICLIPLKLIFGSRNIKQVIRGYQKQYKYYSSTIQ